MEELRKLADSLLKGSEAEWRREDSAVIREKGELSSEGGRRPRILAEVLLRPKRGLRVNLREMPKGLSPKLRKLLEPTRSAGEWGAFGYVTEDKLADFRELLQAVQGAAPAEAKPKSEPHRQRRGA
jgi:hypothetical protein